MLDAIREAGIGLIAAEMEIGLAGMADRPFADLLVEIEQAGLVGDLGARLGRDEAARRRRRDRRLLVARPLADEAARADRADQRLGRLWLGSGGVGSLGLGTILFLVVVIGVENGAAGVGSTLRSGFGAAGRCGASAAGFFASTGAVSTFSLAFALALGSGSFGFTGEGRDCRPSRCALPITALRETPPSSSAIWLAVMPWVQSAFSRSIRSSVHDMLLSLRSDGLRVPASATSDGAVNDQPSNWVQTAPGVPVIRNVNWGGLATLYVKEVRRFFKVQLQTIWAPAVTTLLFLVIFTVALGRSGRMVMGFPFADFLAPGLIVMGMLQNAFANSSFSLLVGKIQGTIVDYLMPPLSTGELMLGMVGASVTRAVLVGLAVWLAMLLWPGVHVDAAATSGR